MKFSMESLEHGQIRRHAAEKLFAGNAGQCWSSPQEMNSAKSGDHAHGFVDDCGDFFRIWNDKEGLWLNTYYS